MGSGPPREGSVTRTPPESLLHGPSGRTGRTIPAHSGHGAAEALPTPPLPSLYYVSCPRARTRDVLIFPAAATRLMSTPAGPGSRTVRCARGKGPPRDTYAGPNPVAPSSTQLSTTCVRILGMAEAESLGAGARDLKVLGRRPAAEARRAVTLAMSFLLCKRSLDLSCQSRRVGLFVRLRRSRIARRVPRPAEQISDQLRASAIARRPL
jgi:hypothetical protein